MQNSNQLYSQVQHNKNMVIKNEHQDHLKSDLDFQTVINFLLHYAWWIAFGIFTGICIGYWWQLTTPKVFTAQTLVTIEADQGKVLNFQEVVGGLLPDDKNIATEIAVIRSQQLLDRVADELSLDDDPEFNHSLHPQDKPGPVASALSAIKQWPADIFALFGFHEVDVPASQFTTNHRVIRSAVIAQMKEKLSVLPSRAGYVIKIIFSSNNPEKSAKIANVIAQQYIIDQLEAKHQATERATDWLAQRVEELRQRADQAQKRVEDLKKTLGALDPNIQTEFLRELETARQRSRQARIITEQLETKVAIVNKALQQGNLVAAAQAAQRPRLQAEAAQANQASTKIAVEQALQKVLQDMRIDLEQAQSRMLLLQGLQETLEKNADEYAENLVKLHQLESEAQNSRSIFEMLLARTEETTLQKELQTPDARILEIAEPPQEASKPHSIRIILLSGLIGGAFILVIITIRSIMDRSLRSQADVEHLFGSSVIAELPYAPVFQNRAKLVPRLTQYQNAPLLEAARYMRTSIKLSNIDEPPQVVMVTSSVPGEGKTLSSFVLATISAQSGANTLIIDCDIRRPNLHKMLNIMHNKGIVSCLSGEKTPEEVTYQNEKLGFHYIAAEKSLINSADLLSSKRFSSLIQHFREKFDFIILDTPPVLSVPDPLYVANNSDMILHCIQWGKTPTAFVANSVKRLEKFTQTQIEFAFTQINSKIYGHYSYGYNNAGAYYNDKMSA